MHRRTLVSRLATLVAGGLLAGCSNNREVPVTAPEGPVEGGGGTPARTAARAGTSGGETTPRDLVVPGWEAAAGPEGSLVLSVTVRNPAQSARTGLVRVVAGAGSDEYVSQRFVSLDAGERRTVDLSFPVAYDRFDADPSLSFEVIDRTPRTPLPTVDATATPSGGTATATATGDDG